MHALMKYYIHRIMATFDLDFKWPYYKGAKCKTLGLE